MKHDRPLLARSLLLILSLTLTPLLATPVAASPGGSIVIHGPEGSEMFGEAMLPLPNGNWLFTDPLYDSPTAADVGAVYLYSPLGVQISMLTGSHDNDQIGNQGFAIWGNGKLAIASGDWDGGKGAVTWMDSTNGLSGEVSATNSLVGSTPGDNVGYWLVTNPINGSLWVVSPYWDNGPVQDAGAVTFLNENKIVTGPVSAANSLVGSSANDRVGYYGGGFLDNGNILLLNPGWDHEDVLDAGAVTWVDGTKGLQGPISPANSLVGSSINDAIGHNVYLLQNGNYVVADPYWDNGGVQDAGAVTWGDANTGITGVVSETNSLVGSSNYDMLGYRVQILTNGNYVVGSPYWDHGPLLNAGAITWGDGAVGISGVVSETNSLVGSSLNDLVGYQPIYALDNGNYIVASPYWDNAGIVNAGAVTWCDGSTGISGIISASNSLAGSSGGDQLGSYGIQGLSNGNYVVRSPDWDNGSIVDAGAVTWGDGTTAISGSVSPANSLVGSSASDRVGEVFVWVFSNGDYAAVSPNWDRGFIQDAGAVTWGDGTTGVSGQVSAANSLVGSTAGDQVGDWGFTELSNGNLVVLSPDWDNGDIADAGAVTWIDRNQKVTGPVSAANSLVGSAAGDAIGLGGILDLANSNFVVMSPDWDNGGVVDTGAATWVNGSSGLSGPVSPANSLTGSHSGDQVSEGRVFRLLNDNYIVLSPGWDNESATDAGAITWGDGTRGITGVVSAANSLIGSSIGDRVGDYARVKRVDTRLDRTGSFWKNGPENNEDTTARVQGAVPFSSALPSNLPEASSQDARPAGGDRLVLLEDGDFVVGTPTWDLGKTVNAGAVTLVDGYHGLNGTISPSNSLVGSSDDDQVGLGIQYVDSDFHLVNSWNWDNASIPDSGAITLGNPLGTITGSLSVENSVLGAIGKRGLYAGGQYNPASEQMAINYMGENLITLIPISRNADLRGLELSAGSLSPEFDPVIRDYTVEVASNVAGLSVTPTLADPYALVEVNGVPQPSGKPTPTITIKPGENLINLTVKAQDAVTREIYSVQVSLVPLKFYLPMVGK